MEKLNNYYRSGGFYFTFRKLKNFFSLTKKTKDINLYPIYIPTHSFSKTVGNLHNLLEENHNLNTTRKTYKFYNFLKKTQIHVLLRVNQSNILNLISQESDWETLNKNILLFSKFQHNQNSYLLDKKLEKTFNKYIIEISPNLDLMTLLALMTANFIDFDLYMANILPLIDVKLFDMSKDKRYNFEKFLDSIKDNSIIFYIINILTNSATNDLLWDLFFFSLDRRINYLNFGEIIICSVFLLENRMNESPALNALSYRIVQICNGKNISLDFKSYELLCNNLSVFKILLDFNKLSFDNLTENIIEDLFYKYLENTLLNDFEKDFERLEKIHLSTSSIILSKRDYTLEDIDFIFGNLNNEIHDINYFKRLRIKKNPFDIFLLVKLLGKNSLLLMNLRTDQFQKIMERTIDCFCKLEGKSQNKIFFMLQISLIKDCFTISKNVGKDIIKVESVKKLIDICYRKMVKSYCEIKDYIYKMIKEIEETDKIELKYLIINLMIQFLEFFSAEKENDKYIFYKDMVIEDMKQFVNFNFYTKKDVKHIISLVKKDNMICEEIKEVIVRNNLV